MKKALSPREILRRSYLHLQWDGEWARVFGYPEWCARWIVIGPSASGKSSFVMQLAKKLCSYAGVLYESYEEEYRETFQTRIRRYHMDEVSGRFQVAIDREIEALYERLRRPKSPHFVIIDSINMAGWSYAQVYQLTQDFPKKAFIFISQEHKGQPKGNVAESTWYLADVKIRTSGYKAYCHGRFIEDPTAFFVIWEEGYLKTNNSLPTVTVPNVPPVPSVAVPRQPNTPQDNE